MERDPTLRGPELRRTGRTVAGPAADRPADRASWSRAEGPVTRPHRPKPYNAPPRRQGRGWLAPALLGSAAVLGAVALGVAASARAAERRHPPGGRFITVDGVRLRYVERGQGAPIVILHGNGGMIEEVLSSGLVDRLARDHRVILFDRPGFGYSERPRTRLWTPMAQARLLRQAILRLGLARATVVGHSLGTQVALSLALLDPGMVKSLVLASGYFFPTARLDVPLFAGPAIPVIGDVMRYTISPALTGLLLPAMYRKIFAPNEVPDRFEAEFPHPLILRPWQLRAASADNTMMIPFAAELQRRYHELQVPVTIICGTEDQVTDIDRQSRRLHDTLPGSRFVPVTGAGHMVHHVATDLVARIVAQAAAGGRAPAP
jgi:pimeloyl-ACP methyl ester carboxylesterase